MLILEIYVPTLKTFNTLSKKLLMKNDLRYDVSVKFEVSKKLYRKLSINFWILPIIITKTINEIAMYCISAMLNLVPCIFDNNRLFD